MMITKTSSSEGHRKSKVCLSQKTALPHLLDIFDIIQELRVV